MTDPADGWHWRQSWSVRPSLDRRLELARVTGSVGAVGVSAWQGREVVVTVSLAHDFDCVRTTLHDCHECLACAYDAETGALLASLTGVDGERVAVVGSVVVIGSEHSPLTVWDFATGHSYRTPDAIEFERFALTQGGRIIVSRAGIISVRDAATGDVEREVIAGHSVSCMAIAEIDGRTLAFLPGREGHLWDLEWGQEIVRPFPIPLVFKATLTTYSGRLVAVTTHSGGLIRFWDLESGSPWRDPIDVGTKYVADIASLGDLLAVSTDLGVQLWDVPSGKQQQQPLPANTAWSRLAATSRDGRPVLYCAGSGWSKESVLSRWRLPEMEAVDTEHRGDILAIAFAGPYLVTAGDDGTLRCWLAEDGTPLPAVAGRGPIRAVAGAELGGKPFAVTGGAAGNYVPDEPLRRWDLSSLPIAPGRAGRNGEAITTALVTSVIEGRPAVLAGGHNGQVYLWDMASGRRLGIECSGDYHPTGIATGVLNGRPVAAISRWIRSSVVLWRLDTLESTPLSLPDFETVWAVWAVDNHDEQLSIIATANRGNEVRRWDLDAGDHTVIDSGHHEVTAVALGYHDNEAILAVGRMDGTLTLRDPRTGNSLGGPFLMPNPIKALAFRGGGQLAVCFDGDIIMLQADRRGGPAVAGEVQGPVVLADRGIAEH